MMSRTSTTECREPSVALRMRSPERLGADLRRYLVAAKPNVEVDWRDVLVDLVPYVDCAQRLGVDPVELFDRAAQDLDDKTRELARTFARRSDITLTSFGWELQDASDGPCYRRTEPALTVVSSDHE
jgi:hypothetical protein